MQITNEVIQKLTVLPPTGDGFKKLSQQAVSASDVVRDRMTEIQRKLEGVNTSANKVNSTFSRMGAGIRGATSRLGAGIGGAGSAFRNAGSGVGSAFGSVGGGTVGSMMAGSQVAAVGGQGAGLGSTVFGAIALLSGLEFVQAGLNPNDVMDKWRARSDALGMRGKGDHLQNLAHNLPMVGGFFDLAGGTQKSFDALSESEEALGRQRAARAKWLSTQRNFAQEAGPRHQADAAKQAIDDMQAKMRLQMQFGDTPQLKTAEANYDREQATVRVLALQKELSKTSIDEVGKRAHLTQQITQALHNQIKAEATKLDLMQDQREAARERMGMERDAARSQADHYRDIIQSERDRINSAKENFGLMDPMKQMAAMDVARKLRAGQELTPDEIDIAQSSDIFSDQLQRYGRRQADKTGIFEQLVPILGAENRLHDAIRSEKVFENMAVKIEQDIKVHLMADQGMQQALVDALTPALIQMKQAIVHEIEAKTRLAKIGLEANNPAGK